VPTVSEVEQASKELENNKASGMFFIQVYLMKYAVPEYVNTLWTKNVN
jgi:hypothetical protein